MNLSQTVLGTVAVCAAALTVLYFFVLRPLLAQKKKHRNAKFAPSSSRVMSETVVRVGGPVPWTCVFNVWLGFSDGTGFEIKLVTGAFTPKPVAFVLTRQSMEYIQDKVRARGLGTGWTPNDWAEIFLLIHTDMEKWGKRALADQLSWSV